MSEWWHDKSLAELTPGQWDALCDGCAKCCLHKLEDEDDGTVLYTRVHCRYLDEKTSRCSDYANRSVMLPDCIRLTPDTIGELDWLPDTCAYRVRWRGELLADWHPLVSGDSESVHRAGMSVRGRSISEEYVHPDGFDEHIVHWVE